MSKVKEEIFQDESPNMIISARNSPAVIVSKFMARNPYKCFFATLTLTLLMSVFVVRSGIEVSIDSKGWTSRNTLISKREMQNLIVTRYRNDLFEGESYMMWRGRIHSRLCTALEEA